MCQKGHALGLLGWSLVGKSMGQNIQLHCSCSSSQDGEDDAMYVRKSACVQRPRGSTTMQSNAATVPPSLAVSLCQTIQRPHTQRTKWIPHVDAK